MATAFVNSMSWAYLHKASTLLSPSPFPRAQLRGPWGPSEGLLQLTAVGGGAGIFFSGVATDELLLLQWRTSGKKLQTHWPCRTGRWERAGREIWQKKEGCKGREGGEERMECGWEWLKLIMQMYETQAMGNKIITLLFQAPRYFIFLHVLEVSQALLHVWACLFISTRFISSL